MNSQNVRDGPHGEDEGGEGEDDEGEAAGRAAGSVAVAAHWGGLDAMSFQRWSSADMSMGEWATQK